MGPVFGWRLGYGETWSETATNKCKLLLTQCASDEHAYAKVRSLPYALISSAYPIGEASHGNTMCGGSAWFNRNM